MSVVGNPRATLGSRPSGVSQLRGFSGTPRALSNLSQRGQAGTETFQLALRDHLAELPVDLFDRCPDHYCCGTTSFGELNVDSPTILVVGLSGQVSAQHQRVDQLARGLTADAEAVGHPAGGAAVVGNATQQKRAVAWQVVESRLG